MHLYGLVEGLQLYFVLYAPYGLENFLEESFLINRNQYCTVGDESNVLCEGHISASLRIFAANEQRDINKSINRARTSVEWSYGEVNKSFLSQDFLRILKLLQASIALL
eukprot:IDg9587t1